MRIYSFDGASTCMSLSAGPVVVTTVRLVPFFPNPAAAVGRLRARKVTLLYLHLVGAFLLGLCSDVCTASPWGVCAMPWGSRGYLCASTRQMQ